MYISKDLVKDENLMRSGKSPRVLSLENTIRDVSKRVTTRRNMNNYYMNVAFVSQL